MKKIVFTLIEEDGKPLEIQTEASGFTGNACLKATEPFLKALGGDFETKTTAEYHKRPEQKQKAR
jgi:hypothetical protein